MPPMLPATKALMLIAVGMFCLQVLGVPLLGWLALFPVASGYFMPWQVLSYAVLHGDVLHLFFNMLGLWMFGTELERVLGQKRYLQLLLAGVLSAAVVQLVFTAAIGSQVPTVGASGALFALLLSYGMLFPDRVIMPLFPPIPMKAKVFVAVFGGLELLLGSGLLNWLFGGGSGVGNVAHFAHLGGMIGAYALMRYWRHSRRR